MVIYDLKQAARKLCPEAMKLIEECLHHKDKRIALTAAEIILERAYGKPEQQADVNVQHRFVIAPQTMEIEEWLERKGQPKPALPPPDDDPEPSTDDDDPDRKLN
jgi:hypothetical protein